jgi:ABC-type multidrug transport system fused ATPase/permease subunit
MPKVLDYFQDKQDKKHELMLMDKQLEQQIQLGELALRKTHVEADTEEFKAVHRHDTAMVKASAKWAATYSATVRPTITYLFMLLFITVEISAYYALISKGMAATDALSIVWDAEITSLFAAILSFWFGGREIRRREGRV